MIRAVENVRELIFGDISVLVLAGKHTPKVGEVIDVDPATRRISIVWIDEGEPWSLPETEVEELGVRFFRKLLSQLND